MSELSLVVPLSALPEGIELTSEGLLTALSDVEKHREAVEHYKIESEQRREQYNALVAQVGAAGRDLVRILDEIEDEYDKARALRTYASEMQSFGASVRPLP